VISGQHLIALHHTRTAQQMPVELCVPRPGLCGCPCASGAGKSTLMDILAGRKSVGNLTGQVLVNKHKRNNEQFRKLTAYVPQVSLVSVYRFVSPTVLVRAPGSSWAGGCVAYSVIKALPPSP